MSKTDSATKRRYNQKAYKRYDISIRKDSELYTYLEAHKAEGHSVSHLFVQALKYYLNEN